MKQIQEVFLDWLVLFCQNNQACSTNTVVINLRSTLTQTKTIEELRELLKPYAKATTVYGPVNLSAQITQWHTQVETIISTHKKAKGLLETISSTPTNSLFIEFLNRLLSDPKALLHPQCASFLSVMANESLGDVLDYLFKLPEAEHRRSFRGSFNDLQPIDDNHAVSLKLLNNLTKRFEDNNPLCASSNRLLQASNEIYNDLYRELGFDEVPLIKPVETNSSALNQEESKCIIL